MQISIFGLGYVGAVTAACLCKMGHNVIGVDPQAEKVKAFQDGQSPIFEPGLSDLINEARHSGKLNACNDYMSAVQNSDISFICVGTPSLESGRLDLTYVRNVCGQIASALTSKTSKHLLIIRSTMLPGSTRLMVESFFKDDICSGKLIVAYCPEFLREGSAVRDFEDPSLSVIGSDSGMSISQVSELMGGDAEWYTWEGAEIIKYSCNFWHALKVTFANEVGRICKHLDLDGKRVMQTVCSDTLLNISNYYMKPGNPFGGSCLPKDVSALAAYSHQEGIILPVLDSVISSNQAHFDSLLRLVLRTQKRKIAILGLSFKSDTDDLRGSPMVALAEMLISQGFSLSIYDVNLSLNHLIGTNQIQISRRVPNLGTYLTDDLESCVANNDVVIVSHSNIDFDKISCAVNPSTHIIDVNGWEKLMTLPCRYEGLCW